MTSDVGAMIVETLDRMLAEACTPEVVRGLMKGGDAAGLWDQLVELGLPQAMLAEEDGAAGLLLADLGELAILFGRHLVPFPIADTILAHALLAGSGGPIDDAPILIVPPSARTGERVLPLPLARFARWALTEEGGRLLLCPARAASSDDLTAAMTLDLAAAVPATGPGGIDLLAAAASLRAAESAGSIPAITDLSVTYAGERSQFGKPLGSFQAIQQQLAVLAEERAAAATAARLAFAGGRIDPLRAGVAKLRTDMAAKEAVAIAHAATGAIGISEEFDPQLHARRLIDARLSHGGEHHWALRIGEARLAEAEPMTLDFVRARLAPTN